MPGGILDIHFTVLFFFSNKIFILFIFGRGLQKEGVVCEPTPRVVQLTIAGLRLATAQPAVQSNLLENKWVKTNGTIWGR